MGVIGIDIKNIPNELIEIFRISHKLGYLELWNHGYKHIRYDLAETSSYIDDLILGHNAINDTIGIQPNGFGFPFNKYSNDAVALIKKKYPNYFIFESDLPKFSILSPEYNVFADGQPNFKIFLERLNGKKNLENIIIQAHPPRWTKIGLLEFTDTIDYLTESLGFTPLKVGTILGSQEVREVFSSDIQEEAEISTGIKALSKYWDDSIEKYEHKLSNFSGYFLNRFKRDTLKNWHQLNRELYPHKPKNIIDIGSGLGNWSLPYAFTTNCQKLVLNDINDTINEALSQGVSSINLKNKIKLISKDLVNEFDAGGNKFDLLICANTFNYLNPINFFKFAKHSVALEGRMILQIQTPAFNKLRYKNAFISRDVNQMAEVLRSDFYKFLRDYAGIFIDDFRYVYFNAELIYLAKMFDFDLLSDFDPTDEIKEENESVYKCYLFKKTNGNPLEIVQKNDFYDQCANVVGKSFGSNAFGSSGIPCPSINKYHQATINWLDVDTKDGVDIDSIRFVDQILNNKFLLDDFSLNKLNNLIVNDSPLNLFAKKILDFSLVLDN